MSRRVKRSGAGIFEKLLEANDGVTALVAVRDGEIVGDVIFTPALIETAAGPLRGMGLGELGVLPARQRVQVLLDILGRPTPVEVDRGSVVLERNSVANRAPVLAFAH